MAAELKVNFITELKNNPTYEGIDVPREFGKMEAWCRVNKKQPTERRFVNWLNRVDAPVRMLEQPVEAVSDKAEVFSRDDAQKLMASLIETDAAGYARTIEQLRVQFDLERAGQ